MKKKLIFAACLIIIAFLILILISFWQGQTPMGWIDVPIGTGTVTRPYSDDLLYVLADNGKEYYVAGFDYTVTEAPDPKVNVPPVHKGLPVSGVLEEAFMGEGIISLRLPSSVKLIEDRAFYNCIRLGEVFLGGGITDMGRSAFEKCTSLKSISIPRTVKRIGETAFLDCSSLEKATFEDGAQIEKIGYGAFTGCTSLNEARIPSSAPLSELEGYVFENCTSLRSFSLPDSVRSILLYAFANCTSLSDLHIGAGLERISEGAFIYCGNIKNITVSEENESFVSVGGCLLGNGMTELHRATDGALIPDSVKIIKPYAFSSCVGLTEIVLGNSVTMLGTGAFDGCTSLKSADLPKGISILHKDVFKGCSSLSSLTVRSNTLTCTPSAFSGCDSLKDIYFSGSESEWDQFKSLFSQNTGKEWGDLFPKVTIHLNQQ